jgi:hypothetical protein
MELLPSGGSLESDVPTLALHEINWESAGNNHLINQESTVGRGFCRESPVQRRGIHPRKGILPGITSLFTWRTVPIPRSTASCLIHILTISTLKKFKYEDLFKIKNKPDPALLRTSGLSN